MSELSLWLDYYDDIYSDFDSRNYAKRRVSDDFIYELRNALKYRKERMNDLVLLLLADKRDEANEKIISGSLKEFFTNRLMTSAGMCRRKLNRGIIFGIAGIVLMIGNTVAGFTSGQTLPIVSLR